MPILIAVDGRSHSEAALRLGAQVACRVREAPTVLTVVRQEADQPQAEIEAIQARAREILTAHGVEVRTRVRMGHPATEIVREAEDGGYDLVIVGEGRSRHLMRRFLLGSTVIRVVEHAPCAVIVAKGRIHAIQRVLLCDSGSHDPSVGLPRASHVPGAPGRGGTGPSVLSRFVELPIDLLDGTGEMVVLHVMSQISAGPGVNGEQLRNGAERLIVDRTPEGELLQRDIAALEAIGIRAQAKVRHGLVVDEIRQEVRGEDYDLVVIGAYRGVGWQRILLDDLAHRLVVELDRPVLVVR